MPSIRHKGRLFRGYQKLEADISDEKDFKEQVVTQCNSESIRIHKKYFPVKAIVLINCRLFNPKKHPRLVFAGFGFF